ncbi:MAG: amphi-Trp domain-containing protein [Herpetosiphonaceae bacterium]|nr:amphi-Trp domain-containing protein [Herpetosiphonaceae bacterium]
MTQQPGSDELKWHMEGNAGEIADILMQFAQELRQGDINVWKGQRELHLDPAGRINFSVDAVVDDNGQEGLHMKLHWTSQRGGGDALGGGAAPSGEPPRPM